MIFFCFSSRRRHTRWPRDWSSDVCSSDLGPAMADKHFIDLEPRRKAHELMPEADPQKRQLCLDRTTNGLYRAGHSTWFPRAVGIENSIRILYNHFYQRCCCLIISNGNI